MLDNVPRAAHHDGGNAMRFKTPRSQTHGLVAHGSIGDENGGLDRVLLAVAQ